MNVDVLQVIKADHDEVRGELSKLSEASRSVQNFKPAFESFRASLLKHLETESDYLYPEVADLYAGAQKFVDASIASHKAIKRILNDLGKLDVQQEEEAYKRVTTYFPKLVAKIEQHLREEEDMLMPRIRELIPTREREELGLVFSELS